MDHITTPTRWLPEQRTFDQDDLSIILVCWNNKTYLEGCLKSLFNSEMKSCYGVIVVDNGSTDGSQQMLCEHFPQVRIIQNNQNLGLSRASNQGIEASSGRYILLLNNDTLVNGDALEAMIQFLNKHPQAGGVGGKLLNPDGSFQAGYANFSTLGEEFLICSHLGELLRPGYPSHKDCLENEEVKQVDWLSSACLMLRRAALDQVGLLDEQYFIYGDETDLQYRMKKAGWPVFYLPSATTVHFGGRSMDRWRRRKMVYRGKMLFYQKNYNQLSSGALRLMFAFSSIFKLIGWAAAYAYPKLRQRSSLELRSNIDVIKLCWKLA